MELRNEASGASVRVGNAMDTEGMLGDGMLETRKRENTGINVGFKERDMNRKTFTTTGNSGYPVLDVDTLLSFK